MKILAVNSKGVGALLIKIFTFSKWNHVGLMFDNGMVYDVTATTGVRKTHISTYERYYKNMEYIDVLVPDQLSALEHAEKQLGKKYDYSAIFGIIFQNRKWEDPDKWFCSELVEFLLVKGGKRRFRSSTSSILPRETYAVV